MRCSSLLPQLSRRCCWYRSWVPVPRRRREPNRVSGPLVHENLAVYFIHGKSAPGKVPLTLEEAMASGAVKVRETSNVNQLEIENLGDDEVFVQSGDIVKGGKQDRTLMVSLLLPPKSGAIPIASFCVEEGRWTARGREDARNFLGCLRFRPVARAQACDEGPLAGGARRRAGHRTIAATGIRAGMQPKPARRQQQVWESVRATQSKLTGSLGASVRSAQSTSSLQLALENEKLMDAQKGYLKALKAAGEQEDDIVGFAFAVNGAINSADVYPSNGLFRKMWSKLLTAGVIEAIGHRNEPAAPSPAAEAVHAFLAAAESGKSNAKALNASARLETREAEKAYSVRDRARRFAERARKLGASQLSREVRRRDGTDGRKAEGKSVLVVSSSRLTAASSSCAPARRSAS